MGRVGRTICVIIFFAISILLIRAIVDLDTEEYNTAYNISSLRAEAAPYEEELQSIRNDIAAKEKELTAGSTTGTAIVGSYVATADDLGTGDGLIVLAQEADDDLIQKAVATGREIAVYCSDPNEERLASLQEKTGSTCVVLVDRANLEALSSTLAELGYTTVLDSIGSSTILVSGLSEIPTCYINANYTDLSDTITNNISSNDVLVYILSSLLTEDQRSTVQSLIQIQVDNGLLQYGTLASADASVRRGIKTSQQLSSEYDQYVAELQPRIDELEQTIDDIYEKWDESTDKEESRISIIADKIKGFFEGIEDKYSIDD